MWFGTDHQVTKDNLNFLWTMPFNFAVPIILLKNRTNRYLKWYLIFNTLLNIIILAGWKFIPQPYNIAGIPLILIFIVRGAYLLWLNTQKPISQNLNAV